MVCDGEHEQPLGRNAVDQTGGGSDESETPESLPTPGVRLPDGIEAASRPARLVEEPVAQTRRPGLVELSCVSELAIGEWMELTPHPASRRQAFANASLAGTD
jgi:hypothetical protein